MDEGINEITNIKTVNFQKRNKMESRKSAFTIVLLSLFLCINSYAQQLKLAELFNEGAVLQRNAKVAAWGTSAPSVKVAVSIQGKTAKVQTDMNGNWNVSLPALKAGGPYTMTVISVKEKLVVNEIYYVLMPAM